MSPVWHLGATRAADPEAWSFHATPPPRVMAQRLERFARTPSTPGPKPDKRSALIAEIARGPDRTCVELATALGWGPNGTNHHLICLRGMGLVVSYGVRPSLWALGPVDKLAAAGMLPPQAAPSPGGDGDPPPCAKPQTTLEPRNSQPA